MHDHTPAPPPLSRPERLPSLGLVATSLKPDERRVPIHPDHFERIPQQLRERIVIEEGYGVRFGLTDAEIAPQFLRVAERNEVIAETDIVLIPKPQHADLRAMHNGQTLWGWPHCVQDETLTQIAIDRQLSIIAFEAMNHWNEDGSFNLHVFHANNELAGYSSVLHALQLQGSTGNYGRRLSATVIGFGATARGAITALIAHGVTDVRVLTNREVAAVAAPIHAVEMVHFSHDGGPYLAEITVEEESVSLPELLATTDLLVNCTLQDPNAPLFFLQDDDLARFRHGSLIIDVSCDEGMGFTWARPTSFTDPVIALDHGVSYYAVDHSPSYLWNSSSWENSAALLPFLETVMDGPVCWTADPTISRALEIQDGVILNPAITKFQHRSPQFPHVTEARERT